MNWKVMRNSCCRRETQRRFATARRERVKSRALRRIAAFTEWSRRLAGRQPSCRIPAHSEIMKTSHGSVQGNQAIQ